MPQKQPNLTIVIPAYMEEKRVGRTLDKLSAFIDSNQLLKKLAIEVIVVTADSKDNTRQVVLSKAKKFKDFQLVEPGVCVGKGRDVQFGMLRANGEAVIFMDADMSTPLKYLPKFYNLFVDGSDVVVATRNLHNHHPNFFRRGASNIGNLLFRIVGGVWIEDSQCGFKLFSLDSAKTCFSRLGILGWGFDMEILAIAKSHKLQITAVRVNDWEHMPGGTFELGMLTNFIKSLRDLAIIAARRIRRSYLSELE